MSTTFATQSYYVRDGQRVDMTGGRSGIAEAMRTSPADADTPAETILWEGDIGQLQVATGPKGGRFSVYRSRPLNVKMKGAGMGSPLSVLRGQITGEKYQDDHIDRMNPAIHRLVWTDCTADVRNSGVAYPIVTSVNTALGTFGARRVKILSPGYTGKVKTVFRANASGRCVFTELEAVQGAQEYVAYANAGPGPSLVRGIRARGFGRGVFQGVLRTTENDWYTPALEDGNSLEVENISAQDCGASGSSAVSVTGWADHIAIRDIHVDSHWNTAAISLRYDRKQADLDDPNNPKTANVIGKGKLLGPEGHAHGTVILDLEGSTIRTGRDRPGQVSKSSRPAILVDSCEDLWIVSDAGTSVEAGDGTNRALHVEHNGGGAIRTVQGVQVGTRAVSSLKMVGNYSGWGPMQRAGQPFSADEYLHVR